MKNWSKEEISTLYHSPLIELIYEAAKVHREHHDPKEVQISKLLSIKTDGCPEIVHIVLRLQDTIQI